MLSCSALYLRSTHSLPPACRCRLRHLLTNARKDVKEVVVIHGYSRGTALRDMVRQDLTHPRIAAKLPTLNEGPTRLLLKK